MNVEILETKLICENKYSLHNHFCWPSVARLNDGKLAMVASGFRIKNICPFGKIIICYSYDEGKTWTLPAILTDTPYDDHSNGVLSFGNNEVIVAGSVECPDFQRNFYEKNKENPFYSRYRDYVNSYINFAENEFEAETILGVNFRLRHLGSHFKISHDNGITFSEAYDSPVTTPHGPALAPDGNILYIGNSTNYEKFRYGEKLECHKIYPDGRTEYVSDLPLPDNDVIFAEPHSTFTKNGTLIVHIRVQDKGSWPYKIRTIYQCKSYDGGITFTTPHPLFPKDSGIAPAHILQHSSGTLISVHNRKDPLGIEASISTDDGETWKHGHNLFLLDKPSDFSYPCSVELSDGKILTVFYEGGTTDTPSVIKQVIWKFV